MDTKILDLEVDDPIEQDDEYRFTPEERRYIDDQIRGTQQVLLNFLAKENGPTVLFATNLDWSQANSFTVLLPAGATTFTFSNMRDGQIVVVRATGATSTLAWPTMKWPGGVVPTQTTAGTDIYTLVRIGDDTYGSVVQDFS